MSEEQKRLLEKQPTEAYDRIIKKWLFPLHSINLKMSPVDKKVLREIQENWSPW